MRPPRRSSTSSRFPIPTLSISSISPPARGALIDATGRLTRYIIPLARATRCGRSRSRMLLSRLPRIHYARHAGKSRTGRSGETAITGPATSSTASLRSMVRLAPCTNGGRKAAIQVSPSSWQVQAQTGRMPACSCPSSSMRAATGRTCWCSCRARRSRSRGMPAPHPVRLPWQLLHPFLADRSPWMPFTGDARGLCRLVRGCETFAILGSALFIVVAPCLMAGLIPWWITRWQCGPPFLGLHRRAPLGSS